MTHPTCPRCDDLADHPDALTCPTCGYWGLRVATEEERRAHRADTQTTKAEAA